MHLEVNGKTETMIFPRFQQLDAVRKLMAHAGTHGPGRNYLIQHSAGSGKSNTIGWLVASRHQPARCDDKPVFNTAIIVTDRIVLDRQLQGTMAQFEQTAGVVKKIDGTSTQLKKAIRKARASSSQRSRNSRPSISTDPHRPENRTFAVIVDEAHQQPVG